MGMRYTTGHGVKADARLAVEWYRKAADLGDCKALFAMGMCCASGRRLLENNKTLSPACGDMRMWRVSCMAYICLLLLNYSHLLGCRWVGLSMGWVVDGLGDNFWFW